MPPVSEKQKRAMFAAAEGKSNLGIPKQVGREFVGKDAEGGHAAGVLFVAPDGDILLLRRASTEENYAGHWALPGGKADAGETPEQAADREAGEEIGAKPAVKKLLDRRKTPTGMTFSTYASPVGEKFAPKLNAEHSGYAWAPLHQLPGPLHPAVDTTIKDQLRAGRPAEDMTPEDWGSLAENFLKWIAEEAAEPEHAADSLAFDRASVREKDVDGRLRVANANISKAAVNDYLGREIPGFDKLGLDPERKYALLRHPDELAAGAKTFDNVPLLSEHVQVTAKQPRKELIVGSTGTDAAFDAPYLTNSLVVWDAAAIARIEADEQRELSCSYRYEPDMTPGTWEGTPYDGVMRNIVANHVALVPEGRAGPDIVVGDAKPKTKETETMSKPVVLSRKATIALGALVGFLKPKLAADAKPNFAPILVGVTKKNFGERKATMAADLAKLVKPMLAKDANVDGLVELLDAIEGVDPGEDAELDPNAANPGAKKPAEDEDGGVAKILAHLKGKVPDELLAQCAAMARGDAEIPEVGGKKKAEDEDGKKGKDEEPITQGAMDAAIKKAADDATKKAVQTAKEIREAERAVEPYVGRLAVAFDSAEGVYRTALKTIGLKKIGEKTIDDVHVDALPGILAAQPLPGAKRASASPAVATDAAAARSYTEMFPGADRIGTI